MDSPELRLADVARKARKINDACIKGQPVSYGGIVGITDLPSFYVSISGPVEVGEINNTLDSLDE